jgi:kinesin family protein 15
VENCLSGFNSSIFAYGQVILSSVEHLCPGPGIKLTDTSLVLMLSLSKTGSGKTYTMWGPLSALSEDSVSSERGLTPRVFEQLFSRIKEVM